MNRSISSAVCSLSVALLLAACGGGGGGDDPSVAVTFDPQTLVANYQTGTTQSVEIVATATDPDDFDGHTLYVYIVDPTSLLSGSVVLDPIDDDSLLVTLQTSSNTTPGHYTGNFTVQLCKDAGCSAQFPGSPVTLPYDITVTQ